jgi:hypothetical protein
MLAQYVSTLQEGKPVTFRPRGNSMKGIINSGDLVTVVPITRELEVRDVVLCRVTGRVYLHLIKAIQDNRYLIGNNRGGVNGWTPRDHIYGVLKR